MMWQTKKLGEICEIVTGNTPKTSHKEYFGDDILWAGPADLDQGVFVLNTNKKLSKKGIKEGGARIVPKDSVLLSCIGNIGKIGIAIEDMATNQQINTFIPNKEILDSKYLYYSIIIKVEDFKNASSQTTIPIINKTKCSNIEIPLPPLKTQKEIVAKLDEKFSKLREAKRLREEALNDTEKILSQTLREIFEEGKQKGWEEKTIGNVAEVKGGKRLSKGRNLSDKETKHPYLRVTDFKNGDLNEQNVRYIDEDTFAEIKRYTISSDDIFISIAGTIGLVCKIPEKFDGANLTENAAKITSIDRNVLKDFLYWQLLTDSVQNEFSSRRIQTTISKLALFKIAEQKILIPSLNEQQKIVVKLEKLAEKIKTLRELQTSQLADLKRLEKSYLREAFNGELI